MNVSFEIQYNPANIIEKDGVRFVDAGDGNTLTGMAIVSVPACPDAIALEMVAETVNAESTTETNEVNKEVPNENETETVMAEEVVAEPQEQSTPTAECPEIDETMSETNTEQHVVETVEEDPRDARIAELEAELKRVNAELESFKQEKALAELQAKQEKVKSFASKQGLDVEDEAVAEAIANLDYEAIANLSMEAAESKEESSPAEMTMASYVDMDIPGKYGDLLNRG